MSDSKSKLPDLKELGSMTNKLFKDLKKSMAEIVEDYKKKREGSEAAPAASKPKTGTKSTAKKKTSSKKNTSSTPKKNDQS